MSQVEVTVAVGDEEDPLIYVSRVQTVIVDSDDSQDLMIAAATATQVLFEEVGREVRSQLSVLTQAVGKDD